MSEAAETNTRSHRRLRFSLRAVLVFFVVVAVGLSAWTARKNRAENIRLRAELDKRNRETGQLYIAPDKVGELHAIDVPTLDIDTWQWRVYVPPGRTWNLHYESGRFMPSGPATRSKGIGHRPLDEGEQLIVLGLRRRPTNDELKWVIKTNKATDYWPLSDGSTQLAEDYVHVFPSVQEQASISDGESLELIRYRRFPRQATPFRDTLDNEGEGILLWID